MLLLALLEHGERHGYELAQLIEARSSGAIAFHAASLYPILYRMEGDGLIEGKWVERTGQRRRRYYRIKAKGRKALAQHRRTWADFFNALDRIAGIRASEQTS